MTQEQLFASLEPTGLATYSRHAIEGSQVGN